MTGHPPDQPGSAQESAARAVGDSELHRGVDTARQDSEQGTEEGNHHTLQLVMPWAMKNQRALQGPEKPQGRG